MSKLAAESRYSAGGLLLFAPVFDIIGRRFHRAYSFSWASALVKYIGTAAVALQIVMIFRHGRRESKALQQYASSDISEPFDSRASDCLATL
jgi:hypothetical protein